MAARLRCPKHNVSLTVQNLYGDRLKQFVKEHQGCGKIEAYDGAKIVSNLTFPASKPN